ncbi:uncharacterized protein METZ01_LOCUS58702 [marine metagenome]|uniref:Uncharacterized protein n=1 Tax=marine metagenome TaxID=408172 RepID=A0A381SR86_9ZZZZ
MEDSYKGSGIIRFIEIIREKHPDTPMVIFSPIYPPDRE